MGARLDSHVSLPRPGGHARVHKPPNHHRTGCYDLALCCVGDRPPPRPRKREKILKGSEREREAGMGSLTSLPPLLSPPSPLLKASFHAHGARRVASTPKLPGSMSQFAAAEFAGLAMLPTTTSTLLAEMDATACMVFHGGFCSELDVAGDMGSYPGLGGLMGFSGDGFLCQHPDSPMAAFILEALPADFLPVVECPAAAPPTASDREESQKQASYNKRRRAVAAPDGASAAGSPSPFSETYVDSTEAKPKKKDSTSRKEKKGRRSSKEEESTPKEVVHVRARRGQATDSHSLAERVRREKINEKMRCLQGLVPGCYKAMGTAVMLDEIINYVQSLQNQVEFLSMKLSAASAEYDFNQELDSSAAMPQPSLLPRVG